MAKKKQNRYRRNKGGRLDMRKGGRVALQMGGPGNINVPDVDRQLTPEEIEAIRKANEATTTPNGEVTTPPSTTTEEITHEVGYTRPADGYVWDGEAFKLPEGITTETHTWDVDNQTWTEIAAEVTWTEGDQDPATGLIYQADGTWARPTGITATAEWIDGEWKEPTADVTWTEGDQDPATGLIYGGVDAEGNELWARPTDTPADWTWNGTEFVAPDAKDEGDEGWEAFDDLWEWNATTGQWRPTEAGAAAAAEQGDVWDLENQTWVASSDATTDGDGPTLSEDGNWYLDENGNWLPTEEFIADQLVKGFTWNAEIKQWEYSDTTSSEAFDQRRAERIARTERLIEAASQGKVIDADGNEVDIKIADPKKAGGYEKNEDGSFKLDEKGNPIPIVAEQAVEAGKITTDMMPPDVVAAQAGGYEYEKNADGSLKLDENNKPVPLRDAEGNPIPKITGETVETITDTDIETARPTGYKRDKDGELILGEDGKPIPITAATYTADTISATEAAEAKATAAAGAILDDSKALAKELTAPALTAKAKGTAATFEDEEVIGAYQDKVIGVLSDGATIENFQKVAGTDLPRVLRAKRQLRKAGLSEEDINIFANDPDALEDKVMEYTEVERGMIAGLPEEALVNVQLDALLSGMDSGEIPAFARPAVAAVNQLMAQRGLDVSTVGRDQLFNAIISAALPIAQSNAQAIKESVTQQRGIEAQAELQNAQMAQESALNSADKIYNLNMAQFSADQNKAIADSKFLQTVTMTEASNVQQTIMQDAVAMAQLDLATLDANTKLRAQNAQAFLQMDLTNLTNEQQTNVLNAQQAQQRLLSNQAADNAAAQFNSASQNQTNQFMANLAAQTDQFNVAQGNAMSQFNATQTNAAEARRTAREADLSKFNAQLVTQTDQFNAQQNFARTQWNAQNAAAVEQSNTQWRRQVNLADTAAQNAVNMQNAQNAFQMSSQSMSFMWQELRDQADFDFRAAENEENRKAQIIATAIANEGDPGKTYGTYLTSLISSLSNSFTAGFGTGLSDTSGYGDYGSRA